MVEDSRSNLDLGEKQADKCDMSCSQLKLQQQLKLLQQLNTELNTIIEASYDGIVICDKDGIMERVNKAYERISGYSRESVIGKSGPQMFAEGLVSTLTTQQVLDSGKIKVGEQTYKSGKQAWIIGTPILDEQGSINKIVYNIRDITEIKNLKKKFNVSAELNKRYEAELKIMREKAADDINLVSFSTKMKQLVEQCQVIARVDINVLFLGESGVGKGFLASFIHKESPRKNGPFIKINCGAIPQNLMETEMFGYEAGAFSGAKKEGKIGVFEMANGGTLLLDEIGDLPHELQVKLLQTIQDQEIRRVGGSKLIKVDVRLLTATNRDLAKMVAEGTFRKDLYYRINTIPVTIPPLRERKEDIPIMLYFFLEKYNMKYNMKCELSNEVVNVLSEYSWPGNVRELENLVERLVVTCQNRIIILADLPSDILGEKNKKISVNGIMPLGDAMEEVERQLIILGYKMTGSTYKTAEILGISQPTAFRKIKKYVEET